MFLEWKYSTVLWPASHLSYRTSCWWSTRLFGQDIVILHKVGRSRDVYIVYAVEKYYGSGPLTVVECFCSLLVAYARELWFRWRHNIWLSQLKRMLREIPWELKFPHTSPVPVVVPRKTNWIYLIQLECRRQPSTGILFVYTSPAVRCGVKTLYSLWTKSPRIYHVCHFESTMLHTDSDRVRVCMTKMSHRHHHNRTTNAWFGLLSVLSIVAFCVTQWNSVAVRIHKWWRKIHKRISQCRQVFNRLSFDTMVNSFVWWPQRATGTKPHQRFAWLQRGRSAHNLNGGE